MMKKNRMMRLASGLLVAVLITTSMISGTFAKYTTQDSASDVARVAKWGVEVIASGSLFGQHYADVDADNGIITSDTGTVASPNTEDVVAPGTKNATGMTFKVTGTPEVDSKITVTNVDDQDLKNIFLKAGSYAVMVEAVGVTADNVTEYYKVDGGTYSKAAKTDYDGTKKYYEAHDVVTFDEDYYPVDWTLTNDVNSTEVTLEAETVEELYEKLATELNTTDNNQEKVEIEKSYTITWSWDFDDNGNGTNDGKDTILGNIIAGAEVVKTLDSGTTYSNNLTVGNDYCTDVKFNAQVTVIQVD